MNKHLSPRTILVGMIAVFIGYFLLLSFARHNNFYSLRLDLGNMDQTVWNVANGHGFVLTDPLGTEEQSRLAVHADFLLILLAPLYLIWSDPRMLILVQVVVVGLGALPLYWIARQKLTSPYVALLFPLGYLLYPPLQRIVLYDFHAVALATTFLLFAYWYMIQKRYALFIIFAILAALGKEQLWMVLAIFGGYIFFVQKNRWLGSIMMFLGSGMFYLLLWKWIPAVTVARQHFALAYLSEFGSNPQEIITHMITQPLTVFRAVTAPDRWQYYFRLLMPVGFLPVLSPLSLIFAAPSIIINTLSNNGLMRTIDYQYNSDIIPFLFIAAVEGYMIIMRWVRRGKVLVSAALVGAMLFSAYTWGSLPVGEESKYQLFTTPKAEKEVMQKVAEAIDAKYSVSATNNIGAHFSQRRVLYSFPIRAEEADFTVVEVGDPFAWPGDAEQRAALVKLLRNPQYKLIAQQERFFAFERITK